jgi:hypothetical protein
MRGAPDLCASRATSGDTGNPINGFEDGRR